MDKRDAEMSVVNNCGDQGNNDRDTESDDLWVLKDRAARSPI